MKKELNLNGLRIWRFILEWAAFVSIICLIAIFALTAGILPTPPSPVDADGLVAKYGMRAVLFLLFGLGGGLCGLLFLLSRFPRLYKYPVTITAANVELQYHIAKITLCLGQLIAAAVTCILMARVYQQNIALQSPEFLEMLALSVGAGIILYLVYFFTARHYR